MRIDNGRMRWDTGTSIRFESSPNHGAEILERRFLVIHYTAGRSLEKSVRTLTSPRRKASAHFVVGQDGTPVQLVDTGLQAWHAGKSEWHTGFEREPGRPDVVVGLNRYSVGLELDNYGALQRDGKGSWRTWWGEHVPDDLVVVATHKNGGHERGWHAYSSAQIQTAYEICEALIDAYPTIEDVLGHDDIAPTRKIDPGPAFPMDSFRSWLFGRGEG